jgi:5,10-methylenetetrahydromethanopterin reductase
VWFTGGESVAEMADRAGAAEQAGVDTVWVAESHLARDALLALAVIAQRTDRVGLGTGVVNPFTRHPAQLAASFATLDDASNGRAICGIGVGTRNELEKLGFDSSKPLSGARESFEILTRLVARETIEGYAGRKFTVAEARLAFRPLRDRMPVYLAAAGPRMCELAGTLADGIFLPYGTPAFLTQAIARARAKAGDRDFDCSCQILFSVDDDVDRARDRVRPAIGLILNEPSGETILEANGVDPAKATALRDGLAAGGIRGLVAAVDDEIVDRLTIAGAPDHCRRALQETVDAGVSHPVISLLGREVEPSLEILRSVQAPGGEPAGRVVAPERKDEH